MSASNLANLVTYDSNLEPDPLSPALNALCAIRETMPIMLTDATAYRPHAISRAFYQRDDLWFMPFFY